VIGALYLKYSFLLLAIRFCFNFEQDYELLRMLKKRFPRAEWKSDYVELISYQYKQGCSFAMKKCLFERGRILDFLDKEIFTVSMSCVQFKSLNWHFRHGKDIAPDV